MLIHFEIVSAEVSMRRVCVECEKVVTHEATHCDCVCERMIDVAPFSIRRKAAAEWVSNEYKKSFIF